MRPPHIRYGLVAACFSVASALCGPAVGQTSSPGPSFDPGGPIEVVVHTGPGGGSDIFAREVSALLVEEGLVEQAWPVINKNGGSGAAAMAYMAEQSGKANVIAATSSTWIVTPLTNAEARVKILDLTPIALIAFEPTIMTVRADSPWNSLKDFVEAAAAAPGTLMQSGGSVTSTDALASEIIQANTGTEWGYLSFEGGGERVAALLGGNASMMFGGPTDFSEHVKAGTMKAIATIGPERTSLFPDAPTLAESGYDLATPQQSRAIMGPPDMPPEAVAYYEDIFRRLVETDGWKSYAAEKGFTMKFLGHDEFRDYLNIEIDTLSVVLGDLGLLAK